MQSLFCERSSHFPALSLINYLSPFKHFILIIKIIYIIENDRAIPLLSHSSTFQLLLFRRGWSTKIIIVSTFKLMAIYQKKN